MNTLKAPKEIVKAHRFIKNGLREKDNNAAYNKLLLRIGKAKGEDLHFVDTQDFISDAVKARLEFIGFNVFGEVIRWNKNA